MNVNETSIFPKFPELVTVTWTFDLTKYNIFCHPVIGFRDSEITP